MVMDSTNQNEILTRKRAAEVMLMMLMMILQSSTTETAVREVVIRFQGGHSNSAGGLSLGGGFRI
jgi:hypothetical protein